VSHRGPHALIASLNLRFLKISGTFGQTKTMAFLFSASASLWKICLALQDMTMLSVAPVALAIYHIKDMAVIVQRFFPSLQ
jgi:hypothetical protein